MSPHPHRTVAATLAALALAAPAAIARPIDPPVTLPDESDPTVVDAPAPRVVVRAADDGFDWESAGIGAAAGLVVAVGGLAAARHDRVRHAR